MSRLSDIVVIIKWRDNWAQIIGANVSSSSLVYNLALAFTGTFTTSKETCYPCLNQTAITTIYYFWLLGVNKDIYNLLYDKGISGWPQDIFHLFPSMLVHPNDLCNIIFHENTSHSPVDSCTLARANEMDTAMASDDVIPGSQQGPRTYTPLHCPVRVST
jgi:hypothetical protein